MLPIRLEDLQNIILQGYHNVVHPNLRSLKVEQKKDGSLVTQVDRELEKYLQWELSTRVPGLWIGEESYRPDRPIPEDGYVWVVDPIDGTASFAIGGNHWGTMVALYRGLTPLMGIIYRPEPATWLTWETGGVVLYNGMQVKPYAPAALSGFGTVHQHGGRVLQRLEHFRGLRFGGMAFAESLLMALSLSEFIATDYVTPWDWGAPLAIHRALGGVDGYADGTPFRLAHTLDKPYIFARNAADWARIRDRLVPAYWPNG